MLNKSTLNSTTSFLVSLLFHLFLLLVISGVWFVGNQGRSIELTGLTETFTELKEVAVDLELKPVEDLLESEPVIEPVLDEAMVIEHEPHQVVEFVDATEGSMYDSDFTNASDDNANSGSGSKGSAFFGLTPSGNRIVYIIDISLSMGEGKYKRRLARAIEEVVASVGNLSQDQEFFVILFSFGTYPIELKQGSTFLFATDENKLRLKNRLATVGLSGGTDPRVAIVSALKLKPSCIFLLTDGEFNGGIHRNPPYQNRIDAYQLSVQYNKSKCPINTVGLEDHESQDVLTRISKKSGGTYVFVPPED